MLYLICFFFNDAATTEIYTSDTLFPYTTLFRSHRIGLDHAAGGRLPAGATVGLTLAGPARAQRHPGSTGDRGSAGDTGCATRSEEHTSELQSLMRISYAVFCLQKKKTNTTFIIFDAQYTTYHPLLVRSLYH